jgi:uncharacterized phage protein gp47/JayE
VAFTARTRDQIRAALLSALSSRYATAGLTLSVEQGSDAYFMADALSVELLQTEAAAESLSHEILPDEAVELLDRHASVQGVTRRAAVKAVLTVDVTGTPSTTPAIPANSLLSSPSGALFLCTVAAVTLDGSGDGRIDVEAVAAGEAGSLALGTVLTWQSAPAGLDPTGEVYEVVTSGEEEENDDALRARLLARIRQRPGSGNSADWVDWCEQCDGVQDAYAYPLLEPAASSGDTLGCVSMVVLGPPQGDSPTNTRILSSGRVAEIKDFINGTRNGAGAVVTDGTQLRPATIANADFEVYRPTTTNLTVSLSIKNSTRFPFAFSGTLTVDTGASTSSSLVVNGDHTAKVGKTVLVKVSNTLYRAEYQAAVLKSGSYDGGTLKTTFVVSLAGAPTGGTAYPAPANWTEIRAAMLSYFDQLGPKDTSTARRWPGEDVKSRATVYLSQLSAVALGVPGVVTCSVTLPLADAAPSDVKGINVLDSFLVTEAP